MQTYLSELHTKKNYPEEILEFDYEKNLSSRLNHAVWDIDRGTVLQLANEFQVVRGLVGFRTLTIDELKELYGEDLHFEDMRYPITMKKLESKGRHWVMNGLFESCNVPVICHIIDLIEKGVIEKTIQ